MRRSASSSVNDRAGKRHGQRDSRSAACPSRRRRSGLGERADDRASARVRRRAGRVGPRAGSRREPVAPGVAMTVLEPALEETPARQPREARAGNTTTKRFGSEPSLAVSTSGSSFSASWTILRSTGVIGSSATRWPVADARCGRARASVSSVAVRRRGSPQRRRSPRAAPPPARVIAFARYWIASIVWPCFPMKSATSGPEQVTVTPALVLARGRATTSAPIPDAIRSTISRGLRHVVLVRRRSRARFGRADSVLRDDVRRREAHAEKPALAFRHDLELTRSRGRGRARAARARVAQPTWPRRPSRPVASTRHGAWSLTRACPSAALCA